MEAEQIKKALEALEQGDDAAAMEILKGMIVSAASGEEQDAEGDEPGAEGDGAEGVATPEAESVIDPKVVPAAETSPEEEDDDDDPKKKMARKALHTMLRTLTGTNNLASALVQVSTFRKSHLTLETERQELANQRAILESAERRQLVVELVKLGAEFPSTVWADATSAKPSKIKPRWAKMPIVELRAHVADQRTARVLRKPAKAAGVRPPRGDASPDDVDENGLTKRELQICSEMKCDPKDFALLKASRSRGQRTAGEIAQDTKDRASRVGEMVSLAMRPKGFKEEGN
jgi:hypothetical protein